MSRATLAAEVRRLRAAARLRLGTGKEQCHARAAEQAEEARGRYFDAQEHFLETKQEASEAWREARPVRRQVLESCMVGASTARDKRRQRKETCEERAAREAREARERHAAARGRAEGAKREKGAAWKDARGAKRAALESCMVDVHQEVTETRNRAERAEGERRQEAKRRRAGKRPPVSPAERAAEEIQRARNDVEDRYPEALPLFEDAIKVLHRRWVSQRATREATGRTHTLGEAFLDLAHDSPELVEEARARDAERWAAEQERRAYEQFQERRRS